MNNQILFDAQGSTKALIENIQKLDHDADIQSILVYIGDDSSDILSELLPVLENSSKPISGGIFPQIVVGQSAYTKGSVAIGLEVATKPHIIESISKGTEHITEELDTLNLQSDANRSLIVLVDGLSTGVNALIESLYYSFSSNFNYLGGGAGSLSFVQKDCLFSNKGIFQDAALVVETSSNMGVGVSHGWEKVAGPFRITESEGNTIRELDYEPAFEVYKKIIKEQFGADINEDNFFEIAKGYPFGISKLDSEMVVRDPITTENKSMICVGSVPTNEYVHILKGSVTSLIEAAKNAGAKSQAALADGKQIGPTLLMDCISRVLYLESSFSKELESIAPNKNELVGALCLGEIANNGDDYLEFFNKTCVVGRFKG